MTEKPKFKFRLSLCVSIFTEVELEAESVDAALFAGYGVKERRLKFEAGPCVYKVERRVPVPGAPGEFRWEKVERT